MGLPVGAALALVLGVGESPAAHAHGRWVRRGVVTLAFTPLTRRLSSARSTLGGCGAGLSLTAPRR